MTASLRSGHRGRHHKKEEGENRKGGGQREFGEEREKEGRRETKTDQGCFSIQRAFCFLATVMEEVFKFYLS